MSLRLWLGINLILKILDVGTTWYFLNEFGRVLESNPFFSNMIDVYGTIPGLTISGIVHTALVLLMYKYEREDLLRLAAFITAIIPISNILTIALEAVGRLL